MASLGRPPKSKRQKTLEQTLGLHSPLVRARDSEGGDATNATVVANADEKKKYKRAFKEIWKSPYTWAFCITDKDNNERVKCRWCTYANKKNPFGSKEGASTLQRSALGEHANSKDHKLAAAIWEEKERRSTIPIQKHIAVMTDDEKDRIITCMQTMWYVAKRNLPFEEYAYQCSFQRFLRTPNMPLTSEYSTYTSKDAGKEFAKAIKQVYWDRLKRDIVASPFYSIQIDESTDISMQQYMIVYVMYMQECGNGSIVTSFLDMLPVKNGDAEALHDALLGFLVRMELPMQRMIGIATDGASVMTGGANGVISRLKQSVPHLLSFHCVAHRESLAAGDAFKIYKEFRFVDKVARKLYEWVCRSAKRHAILADVVKDLGLGRHGKLKLLKMHDVRWLSKGQVMVRVVRMMPALLTVMKNEDLELYNSLTNYKVQFLLHFFADVLGELNILSCKLQEEHPDISAIGCHLKSAVETLQMAFLGRIFGMDTKHTQGFLSMAHGQNGVLTFVDTTRTTHTHVLHLGPMCEEDVFDVHETLHGVVNGLVSMAMGYVRSLAEALKRRFAVDFDLFEVVKFFSPKDYAEDLLQLEDLTRSWLETLCNHFGRGAESFIDEMECKGERRSFITRMRNCFKNKSMHLAWRDCCNHEEWELSFPWTMKLWRALLLLPLSSVACERGFSKMNKIKNKFRNRLSLDMLSLMMFIGLNTPKVGQPEDMHWDECFESWKAMKNRRLSSMAATSLQKE